MSRGLILFLCGGGGGGGGGRGVGSVFMSIFACPHVFSRSLVSSSSGMSYDLGGRGVGSVFMSIFSCPHVFSCSLVSSSSGMSYDLGNIACRNLLSLFLMF